MSDEQVQNSEEQKSEAPVADGGGAPAPAEAAAPAKKKKVNRLTVAELDKKISVLEEANQVKSKYYRHLLSRRNERKA